ncbi:defensin-like protein 5 [Tasmannia lanceolata]|uniref:defensin-like protein 5 n=1 Tax=Tasmannia lanceolata TaxID=3420 RepID=UPI0040640D36
MAPMKKSPLFAFLLLSFLLLASEIGVTKVDARTCEAPSGKFNGLCFRSSNCATVCQSEQFTDGHCAGARRRCLCTKPC